MFFKTKKKQSAESSSDFSKFIREAKSKDKKKVYRRVINEAIEEQNEVVKEAAANGQ